MAHIEKPGHCEECEGEIGRLKARLELLEQQLNLLPPRVEGLEHILKASFGDGYLPAMPAAAPETQQALDALHGILGQIRANFGEGAAMEVVNTGTQLAFSVMTRDLVELRQCLEQLHLNIADMKLHPQNRERVVGSFVTDRGFNILDWIDYLKRYG